MSDSSLPLAATPATGAHGDPGGTAVLRSLSPPLLEWLPRQRWFAGKGRPLTGFSLVAAAEMLPCRSGGATPGLLHLLVRAQQSAQPFSRPHARGGGDCYQLLLGVRDVLPPELAPALIGRPSTGPLRGRAVYEALQDPRLTTLLLERLRVPGSLGPLRFSREPDAVIPAGPTPRPLGTEQSNSSVVYGDSVILKLFRRVEPGVNPDLELPLALARHGCPHVPAPTAWFEATAPPSRPAPPSPSPESGGADSGGKESGGAGSRGTEGHEHSRSMTLGVLQPYLSGTCDGWQLALRALAARRDFTGPAHALGRTTARVHAVLAEALPTSTLRGTQLERQADRMASRLEAASAAVPALRPYRDGLLDAYRDLADLGTVGGSRPAQRVHGDLHLGQALGADGGGDGGQEGSQGRGQGGEGSQGGEGGGGWTLIDFEGEPARPLAERRAHQPVVRDIAGMLRSFDYAACQHGAGPDDAWSSAWARTNRAAYCAGYAEGGGADPREDAVLLRAYETDKAVYEVLYEARNRPAWLGIPMAAIRRLAAPGTPWSG
ncbi:maltokinase [Streptomyces sp. NBC_01186]|uniref:maltokinase N-terminal cap-like domain-containing protein n=1 Tax=Streptomyces sp. NBC_01186 TaxID=2903765 RepID=UPI002E15DE9C|nr:maltokinase [Streptomyces sp. NBC_01186]